MKINEGLRTKTVINEKFEFVEIVMDAIFEFEGIEYAVISKGQGFVDSGRYTIMRIERTTKKNVDYQLYRIEDDKFEAICREWEAWRDNK